MSTTDSGSNRPSHTDDSAPVHPSLWPKVAFFIKATEIRLRFIAVLVGIGLVIGYWDTIQNYWDKWTRPAPSTAAALVGGEEFYCPMHPSIVRDSLDPGGATPKCPICGMPLSKRTKGDAAPLPEGVISRVQLSPYRIQLAGIETAEVKHRPLKLDVRALGYVAVDERTLSRIVVRAAGYVEKLYVNQSFAMVREGDPLAEIYSPDLYSAAQELVIATRGQNQQLILVAREKLKLLGVAESEIDGIVSSGTANTRLIIRSPHSGHVFEKYIVEGERVEAGQTLFEVADLSTVWVEGELYESDAAAILPGRLVEATFDAYPGRIFYGSVSLVHPHVETATRTLRVRCEFENPNHELRPGMYTTLRFETPIQELEPFRSQLVSTQQWLAASEHAGDSTADTAALAELQKVCPVTGYKLGSMGEPIRATAHDHVVLLCCKGCPDEFASRPDYYFERLQEVTNDGVLAIPEQAVIDTGIEQLVYVERKPGVFEGVKVTLGPRAGSEYAVIDGLLAGDRVAAAGAFLVDAETRLNPAASATYFGASGKPASESPSASAPSSTP